MGIVRLELRIFVFGITPFRFVVLYCIALVSFFTAFFFWYWVILYLYIELGKSPNGKNRILHLNSAIFFIVALFN